MDDLKQTADEIEAVAQAMYRKVPIAFPATGTQWDWDWLKSNNWNIVKTYHALATEAIAAWNTRSTPATDVAGLVERLIEQSNRAANWYRTDDAATCTEAATALEAQAAEIARLREAIRKLEAAQDDLCASRSTTTYLSMIENDNAADLLTALDSARHYARNLTGSQSHD